MSVFPLKVQSRGLKEDGATELLLKDKTAFPERFLPISVPEYHMHPLRSSSLAVRRRKTDQASDLPETGTSTRTVPPTPTRAAGDHDDDESIPSSETADLINDGLTAKKAQYFVSIDFIDGNNTYVAFA
jgi:hypothetical protein